MAKVCFHANLALQIAHMENLYEEYSTLSGFEVAYSIDLFKNRPSLSEKIKNTLILKGKNVVDINKFDPDSGNRKIKEENV